MKAIVLNRDRRILEADFSKKVPWIFLLLNCRSVKRSFHTLSILLSEHQNRKRLEKGLAGYQSNL